jgi:hypothetical protein
MPAAACSAPAIGALDFFGGGGVTAAAGAGVAAAGLAGAGWMEALAFSELAGTGDAGAGGREGAVSFPKIGVLAFFWAGESGMAARGDDAGREGGADAGRTGMAGSMREVGGMETAGFSGAAGTTGADAFFAEVGMPGSGVAGLNEAGAAGAPGGLASAGAGGAMLEVGGLGEERAGVLRSGTVGSAGPAGLAGTAGPFASAGRAVSSFSTATAARADVMGTSSDVPSGSGLTGGSTRGCSGGVARSVTARRCEADFFSGNGGVALRCTPDLEAGSGLAGETGWAGVALAGRAGTAGEMEVEGGFAGDAAGAEAIENVDFFAGAAEGSGKAGSARLISSGRGNALVAGLVVAEEEGDTVAPPGVGVAGACGRGPGGTKTGADGATKAGLVATGSAGVRRSEAVGGRTWLVGGLGDRPEADGGLTGPVGVLLKNPAGVPGSAVCGAGTAGT